VSLSNHLVFVICYLKFNVINLRIGVISLGAAFQPRLNDYGFRATSFFISLDCKRLPNGLIAFRAQVPLATVYMDTIGFSVLVVDFAPIVYPG